MPRYAKSSSSDPDAAVSWMHWDKMVDMLFLGVLLTI